MKLFPIIVAYLGLIVTLIWGSPASAISPGLNAGMSLTGMSQIANSIIPFAVKAVKEFDIPDFSGKKGIIKFTASHIRFKSLYLDSFICQVVDDKIRVGISGLHANVALNWKYSSKTKVPFGSGTAAVRLSSGLSTIDLSITNGPNKNNEIKPNVRVTSTNINLDKLKIDIHGSLLSWIYSMFTSMFSNTIRKTVESTVASSIKNTINDVAASIIDTLPMRAPISNWGVISYALTSSMLYSGSSAFIGFDFETLLPAGTSDGVVPRHNIQFIPSDRMFEGLMDVFVLNSLCHAYYMSNSFTRTFDNTNKPANFPVELNTANWILIPQLQAKYPNAPMQMSITLSHEPVIAAVPDHASFTAGVDINLQVLVDGVWTPALGIRTVLDAGASFSLNMEYDIPVFHVSIDNVTPTFQIINSTIGNPDISSISKAFSSIINKYLVPLINTALFAGIPIPSVNGISLVNASFKILENSVYFGTDLTFSFSKYL